MPYADPAKRKAHHREYMREVWYPKNKKKHMEAVVRNKREIRAKFRALKSRLSCNRCEENHPACLDFHHTDPSTKEFAIAASICAVSRDRLLREIAKCEVLCANCHRKEHAKDEAE